MSEKSKEKPTIQTPVPQEILGKFRILDENNAKVALRYMELEEEKIKLLRLRTAIAQERKKLFEGLLVERGLSPDYPVEINGETGVITPVRGVSENTTDEEEQVGTPSDQVPEES